ncbi:NmrA domain-containing protein [Mycena chlorophos]|uniref:NmrA domain-containing protein n=1 Tax=Mycena chlorophos TaxID=658473 RepID=A0A8H6S826_MYCCL|nr:NmrA domain-containing protein [Mycena chlorophos]
MPKRIIAVTGATGVQGSSVIRGLLRDTTFTPRAISRDPHSPAAEALKSQGVEVVKADASDKRSLVDAFRGCEAVFAMTGLTTPGVDEVAQGKNLVDAAKEAGVKFFLWSGLPNMTKLSGGKYTGCFQYDKKAEIEDYLHASGLPNTTLHLGLFLDGLQKKHRTIRPNPTTGALEFFFTVLGPDDEEAFSWIGHDLPRRRTFPLLTARISMRAFAGKISTALGREIKYRRASEEEDGGGSKLPIAELDEMLHAHRDGFAIFADAEIPDPTLVRLGMQFGTLEQFLEEEIKPLFQ